MYIQFIDYPGKFFINDVEKQKNIKYIVRFDRINIKSILNLSEFWGIETRKQREFSIVLTRQFPQFQLCESGSLELNSNNRLLLYTSTRDPIELLEIVYQDE